MDRKSKSKTRRTWALTLNLVVPGAGLVILHQDIAGIALAVLFALFAQIALLGLLVVPANMPPMLSTAAGVVAGAIWLIAQWLGWKQARIVFGAQRERELHLLRERVTRAVEDKRYTEAGDLLNIATRIDDEDLDLHLQTARIAALTGQFHAARQAWRRVMQLDNAGLHRLEALEALGKSQSQAHDVGDALP